MQNWVCANCAPAAIFAVNPLGSHPAGGSIGLSAAPRKNSAFPLTFLPLGNSPVSRSLRAVSSNCRASRSNTGLASGWSPADGSSPRSTSRLRTPKRRGAHQFALQADAVAVAAGELEDRLDAFLQQNARRGHRAEMRPRARPVSDVHRIGEALSTAAPCRAVPRVENETGGVISAVRTNCLVASFCASVMVMAGNVCSAGSATSEKAAIL